MNVDGITNVRECGIKGGNLDGTWIYNFYYVILDMYKEDNIYDDQLSCGEVGKAHVFDSDGDE